jgi:uncharacterized membrane protein
VLAFTGGIGLLRRFGVIAFFASVLFQVTLKAIEMDSAVGVTLVCVFLFLLPNAIYFKKRWEGLH